MQRRSGSGWVYDCVRGATLTGICALYLTNSSALAETSFRPPASVLVLDSRTQSIRPVIGQPGAWIQDQGLDLGIPVLNARFSPERDFALIQGGADTPVIAVVTGLKSGPVSVTPIQGALGSANALMLNDSGTAGLLYSDSDRQVQFLGGLPGAPMVVATIAVDSMPGPVVAMTLNSTGDLALIGLMNDSSGSIYRLRPGKEPEFVTSVQKASAIVFESDQSALVADSDAGQILRIDAQSGGGATLVADGSRGIRQPKSLQVLSNSRVLVGQTDDNSVTCLDLNFGLDSSVTVPVPPAAFDRFSSGYFVLNQPGGDPVYVLEMSSLPAADCTQKIWFIPAD